MTLSDDIKAAVGSALCSTFQGYEKISRWTANLFYPDKVDDVFPRSPAGSVANSGIALFCNRSPDISTPAFVNGQCPQGYQVFSGTDISGTIGGQGPQRSENNPGNVFNGPFTGVVEGPKVGGSRRFYFVNPNYPAGSFLAYTIDDSWLNPRPYITLIPVSGNPDNCGNRPRPQPLPESDRTAPININNNTGPVIFFPPIINVNGDLQVPFNVDVGGLNIDGTIELNTGDITFNFGGQPTDPNAPVVPTPDGTVPSADMDDPENNKKANIIGVIVVSTRVSDTTATEVPSATTPELFIPRLADVLFKIRIKNKSHWTSDIPVKTKNAYIPCPGEIDAIDVKIIQRKGWSSSITPVRGIVPSNQVELI